MITVFGASDDCIEIEGKDLREEFYASADELDYVAFSNGVVLSIKYDGDWIIRSVANPHKVVIDIAHPDPDNDDEYTDIATIHDDAEWVVCGNGFEKKKSRKA